MRETIWTVEWVALVRAVLLERAFRLRRRPVCSWRRG
jgi:hypothetical protein